MERQMLSRGCDQGCLQGQAEGRSRRCIQHPSPGIHRFFPRKRLKSLMPLMLMLRSLFKVTLGPEGDMKAASDEPKMR